MKVSEIESCEDLENYLSEHKDSIALWFALIGAAIPLAAVRYLCIIPLIIRIAKKDK